MNSTTIEANFLEEAVCKSKEKELHIFCHAKSGRGWVEVGGRRYVGNNYVEAARRLHEHQKLSHKHTDGEKEVFELGHHSCSKAQA